jgi:GT2 family glycosyltransferase
VPRVTVSIVNYRTAALTLACVESVLADLAGGPGRAGPDGEVVVVDNASADGSAERIADWIAARPGAPVTLIRSPRNGGFAAGHNLALAGSAAEFVLLLNSDAELRPGCLGALVAALEAQPRAGIAVPRIEAEGARPAEQTRDEQKRAEQKKDVA